MLSTTYISSTELPPQMANKARFPPGCPVWYHPPARDESCHAPLPTTGRVVNVVMQLDMDQCHLPKFLYEIRLHDNSIYRHVSETSLQLASQCPSLMVASSPAAPTNTKQDDSLFWLSLWSMSS
eukprot:scaffold417699_cov47-Attheya_sp.AAC.2